MRSPSDKCLLCKSQNATSKKNSHIIPKFLGKKGNFRGDKTSAWS